MSGSVRGQHKQAPGLLARAHRYVTACGFAVAAIDAPGHGGRPGTEHDERLIAGFRERMAAGEPIGPHLARYHTELSARVTVPVEFLLQWDDELVPRGSGLALFDAFASGEKTLHANLGRHAGVPRSSWRARSASSPATCSQAETSKRIRKGPHVQCQLNLHRPSHG
jgi:hypothetical protein